MRDTKDKGEWSGVGRAPLGGEGRETACARGGQGSRSRSAWVTLCVCVCVCVCAHSVMSNSATPWTVACQAPLSMEFSRQEYQSGLSFRSSGDLPDQE